MKYFRSMLVCLLLAVLIPAAAWAASPVIRQPGNDVILADGTLVAGVWENAQGDFLTLKADGDAILYVSDTLYVCSWSWSAEAVYLDYNGWILTITPQNGKLQAEVHGKTMILARTGDFDGNVGVWYPTATGGGYTLQLRASGEYYLKRGSELTRSGKWLDAGGYVILYREDGGFDVCARKENYLKLRVGLSVYSLAPEAPPTATPRSYATSSPTPTPAPVVDERLVGCWRPSGSDWSLLLNGDGTAVLGDGKQVESGYWRLSGNRCTIVMASQTYEATYNSVFIRMTLDGKTLNFSKKGEAADVTGAWAADGYALVISADGSFAGSWGGGAYSGSWQFDGQNVYLSGSNGLTVFKVASGKLQIKVNGKTVRLVQSGAATEKTVLSVPGATGTSSAAEDASAASTSSSRRITGTWTEVSLGSDVTLTIRSNTTAELCIYNSVYSCKWQLSGGVLTLTNNGVPITGSYDSQTGIIQLTVDTYQLSFRKSGTSTSTSTSTASGGIEGTWTQHVTGGTVTLTLRSGGSATLKIATTQYACTWKLSGSTLTLTNNGIPMTGTYNSQTDTISITIGTARLNLTRTGN